MEFKFLVAANDMKGLPGLEKGDAVVPVATEIVDGYEYDVWHRLDNGLVSKTRIEHHSEFITIVVDGKTRHEIMEKVAAASHGVRDGK